MKKLICSLLLICAMPFAFAESIGKVASQVVKTDPTEAEAKEVMQVFIDDYNAIGHQYPYYKQAMEEALDEYEISIQDLNELNLKGFRNFFMSFDENFTELELASFSKENIQAFIDNYNNRSMPGMYRQCIDVALKEHKLIAIEDIKKLTPKELLEFNESINNAAHKQIFSGYSEEDIKIHVEGSLARINDSHIAMQAMEKTLEEYNLTLDDYKNIKESDDLYKFSSSLEKNYVKLRMEMLNKIRAYFGLR